MKREKTEKTEAGNTHMVDSVWSGADPDEFVFPVAIPQEVAKKNSTHSALQRFFKQHGGTD